jgi:hypothetical protein
MPTADPSETVHTVIVTVDADPETIQELQVHAEIGIQTFPRYAGFLGGVLHLSDDRRRLVQYLRWRSVGEYEDCVNDPAWEEMPSGRSFLKAVEEGRAQVDARSFTVARMSGPAREE